MQLFQIYPHKQKELHFCSSFIYEKWSHLGLNQGPPDYESGALTS